MHYLELFKKKTKLVRLARQAGGPLDATKTQAFYCNVGEPSYIKLVGVKKSEMKHNA